MPVYVNRTEDSIPCVEGNVAAGKAITTKKYIYPLPDGLDLYSDTPRVQVPWVTKKHGTINATPITGLAGFETITIVNNSGAVIEVTPNGDSANVLYILNGATWVILQDREIDRIVIAGSGEGSVYVFGQY